MDIDCGQFVGCRLQDVAVVMGLHELAPVGRWASSGCERRRHEIGEPVQELKRRELDDTAHSRPGGLPAVAGPDPVGGL